MKRKNMYKILCYLTAILGILTAPLFADDPIYLQGNVQYTNGKTFSITTTGISASMGFSGFNNTYTNRGSINLTSDMSAIYYNINGQRNVFENLASNGLNINSGIYGIFLDKQMDSVFRNQDSETTINSGNYGIYLDSGFYNLIENKAAAFASVYTPLTLMRLPAYIFIRKRAVNLQTKAMLPLTLSIEA